MTEKDSPIIDFYPETFEIDMNGKKMAWQGVALLPFIDEKRLLDAMSTRYSGLSYEEIERNKWGNNTLFVADEHPLYPTMESLYAKRKTDKVTTLFLLGLLAVLMCSIFSAYSCQPRVW